MAENKPSIDQAAQDQAQQEREWAVQNQLEETRLERESEEPDEDFLDQQTEAIGRLALNYQKQSVKAAIQKKVAQKAVKRRLIVWLFSLISPQVLFVIVIVFVVIFIIIYIAMNVCNIPGISLLAYLGSVFGNKDAQSLRSVCSAFGI